MADEVTPNESNQPSKEPAKKGLGKKKMIIIALAFVLLIGGGVFGYTMFFSGKDKAGDIKKEEKSRGKVVMMPLEPFILNLAEHGRFLKLTLQFELSDPAAQPIVNEKIPQLRDAIITLVSSKSAESLSSPEGKFLLKDEILLRANQAIGRDVFKNLYFTEFVMQ